MFYMYLRKSRADSESETVEEVLAKHYKILQDYAIAKLGGPIPESRIYREVVSGETIQDRPEMLKLLDLIQHENITGVLVVEPQRLSRGDLSDCGTIIRAFRYTQTLIVTPPKTYNLEDKFDRKYFEMELMRGNDYLEYIKEILMRGRLASVQAGNYVGSIAPYGYDRIKDGKSWGLVPNSEATIVRMIFDLWTKEGVGSTSIANKLNELHIKPRKSKMWNHKTIRDILKNPVYIGKIRWKNKQQVKKYDNGKLISMRIRNTPENCLCVNGKHEAIISEEDFYAAQDRFGKVPKNSTDKKLLNPFAGIIHCTCGKAMSYRVLKDAPPRLMCVNMKYCNNHTAIFSDVVEEVLKVLRSYAVDVKQLISAPQNTFDVQKALSASLIKELNSLESQQERLYEFLEKGIYTSEVFVKRNEVLSQRRSELQEAIAEAEEHESKEIDYKERYVSLIEAIEALEDDNVSAEDKNRLLRTVIKNITYSRITTSRTRPLNVPFTLDIELL